MAIVERLPQSALLLLPGALTVYLSFNGGGFFVEAPALAAIAVAIVLAVRTTLARRPFEGLGVPAAVVGGALALYAVWTLLSATWSDAPGRATLEADRVLLYLLVFVLFASLPRSSRNLAWILRGLALGIVAVCVVALVTRVAPDVWPIGPNIHDERLSYPITYWNALGLLAVLGAILSLHLTASDREPHWVRLPAAAAIPLLSATVLLTLSRGAVLAAAVGVTAYLVVGRPKAILPLAAVLPPSVVAVVAAYEADLVGSEDYTSAAAVDQGHRLALILILCAVAAAAVRALFTWLEPRLAGYIPFRAGRRAALAGALAVCVMAIVAVGAPLDDAPAYVERQYERFVEGEGVLAGPDSRGRLTSASSNGRSDQWRVAIDRFSEAPLNGAGAGTYRLSWARYRPGGITVNDAHSLYIEVLGELGLVGLALIAVAIVTLLVVAARRARGPHRALYGAVFAAILAWAVHAGFDWDWELPAVTAWVFALGGAAVAARAGERRVSIAPSRRIRVPLTLLWIAVAVLPALAALSQLHLERSVAALKRDDCEPAIQAALSSLSALPARPEPWEVIGYCDARLGRDRLAIRAFRKALDRDPDNWELHYGLAVVQGIARRDPRPAARRALELNPHGDLTRAAVTAFRGEDADAWRRQALRAPLPVD